MKYKENSLGRWTSSLNRPALVCSPAIFVGSLILVFGSWHVGSGLAQYPGSHAATTVGYPNPSVVSTSFASSPISSFSPVSSSSSMALRDWALDVANAKINLDANQLPDIPIARERLDRAMMELENFLATSPQHQANWLAFLAWNELRTELKKESPNDVRLSQLEKTFRQNYLGLEMRQFTHVRDALSEYSIALKFSSNRPKAIEAFGKLLSSLSEQLQKPNQSADFEATREIGKSISFLSKANQASNLVSAIRSNFSRSNARVLVSSAFVQQRFSRPVNEANPVNELILGTQIYGQSWLQGFVTPQLLDSHSNAALRLELNANLSSENIGYNRSVKLYTQGAASVFASETIALTDNGLTTLNDTSVDASLSSQINDIEARLRIVRKIASKKAAEQKPQADAIAEGRLENRIRNEFHQKLAQQVSDANQKIKTPDLPVLKRLGLDLPNRTTWSSPSYLALLWKVQGHAQLAAPRSCPLVVDPSGITVQLHESVVTNVLDPLLAGRIIKNTDLDSLAVQFGDALGKGLVKPSNDEPFAITMADYHPVEIQLDNSLVTFRIRTEKLDRGDRALKQAASIKASYTIELIDGAIQFRRQGDIDIDFSGSQQRGSEGVVLRSFLKRKFTEVFKEQLLDTPLRLTDRLPSDFQGLGLYSIQVDDGWIQAHLR